MENASLNLHVYMFAVFVIISVLSVILNCCQNEIYTQYLGCLLDIFGQLWNICFDLNQSLEDIFFFFTHVKGYKNKFSVTERQFYCLDDIIKSKCKYRLFE